MQNESTSVTLEDSTSTTADQVEEREQIDAAEPQDQPAPQDQPTGDPPETAGDSKDDPKKKPVSAIQAAIDRLARPEPPKPEAAAKEEDEPTPKTPAPQAGTGEDLDGKPKADDPLSEWSREERKHTKGSVKERFRKMDAKVRNLEPLAEVGKTWDGLIEKHQLDQDTEVLQQDQVAWSIKAQAAIIRAVQSASGGRQPSAQDIQVLDQVRAGLDQVDRHLGREQRKPTVDVDALDKLIQDYEHTLDPEKLRAFIADQRKQSPKAAPPVASEPPPTMPAAPVQPVSGEPSPEQRLYSSRIGAEFTKRGIKPEQRTGWFNANVLPVLSRTLREVYPGMKPDVVFERLPFSARFDMMRDALEKVDQQKRSKTPSPSQPTGTPIRTTAVSRSKGASSPLAAAIDRLAAD